jgi:hypothetical protein
MAVTLPASAADLVRFSNYKTAALAAAAQISGGTGAAPSPAIRGDLRDSICGTRSAGLDLRD